MMTTAGRLTKMLLLALPLLLIAGMSYQAVRGGAALLRRSTVGGVTISTYGVLSEAPAAVVRESRQSWEEFLQAVPEGMDQPTEIRKISLTRLEAALHDAVQNRGGQLPPEIQFLAGIQRVEYVLVYPDQQDIVLAGPGEAWKVDDRGNVVGEKTGLPVVQLEDLLVAFRTVHQARDGELSCSIEPQAEGVQRLRQLMRVQRQFHPSLLNALEQALGPQKIVLQGVPDTSHAARVMVAADYRMKRIAMHLESSPLRELPSFLEMASRSNVQFGNIMPRWWLACDYQPLARSEDGLAWQLRGQGVKVLTEQNIVAADGSSTPATGRRLPLAERWADTMTQHYDKLTVHEPIFGQLRNLMDLCVLAALIEKEGLREQANLGNLPYITELMVLERYHPPQTIGSQASFIRQNRGYLITASGGVDIDSWSVASESAIEPSLTPLRQQQARGQSNPQAWWWD